MGEKPNSDWPRILGNIDQSIARCLESLDHYESKFHDLLIKGATPNVSGRLNVDAVAWYEKLAAAESEVTQAEQLIAEQEAVWTRRQTALAEWQISVQQIAAN